MNSNAIRYFLGINSRNRLSRWPTLLVILLIGGCANVPPEQIAHQAVAINQAIEETNNELMLLNIVRAYRREPRAYSDFTHLQETQGAVTLSGLIHFPLKITGGYSPPAPSVEVMPRENTTFISGLMTPVTANTLLYYIQAGWSKSLLLHILVKDIAVVNGGNTDHLYVNNPQSGKHEDFEALVNSLAQCYFDQPKSTPSSPDELEITAVTDNSGLCRAALVKLGLAPSTATDGNIRPSEVLFDTRSPEAMVYYLGEVARTELYGEYNDNPSPSPETGVLSCTDNGECQTCKPLFVLHSEDAPGMNKAQCSYYALSAKSAANSCGKRPSQPVLRELCVAIKTPKEAERISVTYADTQYWITKDGLEQTTYSLDAIGLVQQITELQTQGASVPAPCLIMIRVKDDPSGNPPLATSNGIKSISGHRESACGNSTGTPAAAVSLDARSHAVQVIFNDNYSSPR